jgi:hypothetical protein
VFKQAENELLTRAGPGTAMGAVMRRYWIPVLLREEIPDPVHRGDPLRYQPAWDTPGGCCRRAQWAWREDWRNRG